MTAIICTIHEVHEAGDQAFIVMEYIEGRPLSDEIPPGGLPLDTVIRFGTQIADALAHAHERGIVHRDLKSANVLITPDGRAKVLDFGLATRAVDQKLQDVTRSQTAMREAGSLAGTLPYMAPEVLRGGAADARTDVWALGVLLHEMATGARPFTGQICFELTAAILEKPPASLPPHLPPGFRAIVARALAKEPWQRYPRASDVRAVLETVRPEETADTTARPRPTGAGSGRWNVAVAASVLVLVAVGIALGLAVWPRETVAPVRTGPIRSVAVLPLDNFSKDAGQDYFVDGMTEALIADLSKIRALRVISRTSVMRYKGTKKPLADIARELNVDAILEGSVLHAGDRVRITAQLVDAADDRHLWSESYERDTRDVLAIQREVALAVAGSVQLTVSPEEAARLANRRVEPRAYELYLRGLYQYNQGDLDTSLKTFEQVVAADPNYAPAYAGQARGYFFLGLFGMLPPQEAFPKMKSLALEALKRDAFSSDGHGYLALATLHYDLDWGEADSEFRRSLDLNPSNAEIRHLYAHYLMGVGRRKESVAESRRAVELDPLGLVLTTCLGWHELFVRAYPQAAEAALRGAGMEPKFSWAHTILGWAYEQQGKLPEAITEFQTALKLWPDSALNLSALGHAYAVSGRGREAEALLAKLLDQSKQSYVSPYDLAVLYYGLGRIDDALAWLERAYQRRAGFIPYLNLDPRFDGLRSDARFRDLLTRIGFPE